MQLNGIDLFAGAGGLSEGFIQAGFNILATVEKDTWACETQKTRHIFHHLKKIDALDDYWEYCRETSSIKFLEENRQKIYDKHSGLEDEINNTIWQAEFGNPSIKPGTHSANDVIKHLEKSVKFHDKEVDFILGGPPCQVYSVIGRNQRKRMKIPLEHDDRNFLFEFYCAIVKHFTPQFFLFENVPGITSAKTINGNIFEMIKKRFDKIDYDFVAGHEKSNIHKNVHNALDFGVPQVRKRFIFLGIRKGTPLEYPRFDLSATDKNLLHTKYVLEDLPSLKPLEGHDHKLIAYHDSPPHFLSPYAQKMRKESRGVMNHKARPLNRLNDQKIYREAIVLKSQSNKQLDYSELPEGWKTHKNEKSFRDRFKVHGWKEHPHTIVAHIAKDGHYNIHPDPNQLRSITVREAARIQSFPDNFRFEGPRTAQFTQVGNAVPPLMAKSFAEALKKEIEKL